MSDFEISPFTGEFDLVGGSFILSATEPSPPSSGSIFWLQTVSPFNLYCYRASNWWNIGTLADPDLGRRSSLWMLLPNIVS